MTIENKSFQAFEKLLQQFIKEHLAPILHAEAKGAIPGEPDSLPKKKRRRDEDAVARIVAPPGHENRIE